MRSGFRVRSAEDECDIPEGTGEHWDLERGGRLEVAYAVAAPSERARLLREYVAEARYEAEREENAGFAQALASAAGFTRREIRNLLHLKDGAVPEGGWKGDAFRFSVPSNIHG